MQNSGKSIYPVYDYKGVVTENPNFIEGFKGLTKREHFAIIILQGLIIKSPEPINSEALIKEAFKLTDEFLKILDKEQ